MLSGKFANLQTIPGLNIISPKSYQTYSDTAEAQSANKQPSRCLAIEFQGTTNLCWATKKIGKKFILISGNHLILRNYSEREGTYPLLGEAWNLQISGA